VFELISVLQSPVSLPHLYKDGAGNEPKPRLVF